MPTTNVTPDMLNYDSYKKNKYDQDIINAIPYHKEIHTKISNFVHQKLDKNKEYRILDLGVGTGITSKLLLDILPNSQIDVIDFSQTMLDGAKERLGDKNINYILADYSDIELKQGHYDIIVTMIGLHHQNDSGKESMINKIHSWLKPDGIFFLGDLATYADKKLAALNQAKHFYHLVKKAEDTDTLADWSHHHIYLNDLATKEQHETWLKIIGFSILEKYQKINTLLLISKK